MTKLTNLFWGTALIAAATFTTSALAAPPCFENDTTVEAQLWGLQGNSKSEYVLVKPDETVCALKDEKAMVGVAFLADEPPFVGEVTVPAGGLVKAVREPSGYFLTALDAEGNQIMKTKLAQPRN